MESYKYGWQSNEKKRRQSKMNASSRKQKENDNEGKTNILMSIADKENAFENIKDILE